MQDSQPTIPDGYKQTDVGVIPEDWKVSTVGREFEIKLGKMLDAEKNVGTLKPYLGNKSIQWDRIEIDDLQLMAMTQADLKRFRLRHGDLLVCEGGEVGRAAIWESPIEECYYQKALHRLRALRGFDTKLLLEFLHYWTAREMLANYVSQTSIAHLTHEKFAEVPLPVPPLPEQQAIAEVLSDVDALVSSLDQLIAKKRNIKQGAMQLLLTGKKRLAGFSGDWKEFEFPEICWFQEGPGVRNSQFTNSGVKLLNGTNITNGKLNLESTVRFISELEAFGMYAHFLADEGDIIIACSGISIEKFHEKVTVLKKDHLPLCMNTSTMRFKVFSNLLEKMFMVYFLQSAAFKKQIGGTATGSAQLNFGPFHVKKVKIPIPPSIEEQKAIARILSDMDAEIEALEKRREKYKAIKQGMMQELLTGKTRLPVSKEV